MKFVRENLFLIVVAVIVLLGGGGMLMAYFKVSGDVEKAVDDRMRMAKTLAGLEGRGANAEMEEAAQKRIDAIRASADTVKRMCVEWNRAHMQVVKLAVPNSQLTVAAFPYDPQLYRDEGLGYVFTDTYIKTMQDLLNSLHPTSPPTDGEIQSQQLQWQNRLTQWKQMEASKSPTPTGYRPEVEFESDLGAGGVGALTPLPPPEAGSAYGPSPMPALPTGSDPSVAEEASRRGRDSAMLMKARRGVVYTDPCALDMVFTEAVPDPPVAGLWQAQLNLWVTSDIIAAINATNEEAFAKTSEEGQPRDVLMAAVKRLARIDVNENYVLPTVEAGLPASPYADEEVEVEERYGDPGQGVRARAAVLTGRGSCSDYDVLHYTFTVVMASRYLPTLERHLLSRNYHTILSVQIRPADAPISTGAVAAYTPSTANYYYGPEPVVQVEIRGEVLLLTDWERGTWDPGANAWSDQFPPLIPPEALKQQYTRASPALRPEDVARIPEEPAETGGAL
ncbi:MAG: hypothetical protein MUP47_08920 [Phycisphaerae bacterium]|nr:hypothetical protein [Phycisphaerae bacterium]